jgi:hypothetical protein
MYEERRQRQGHGQGDRADGTQRGWADIATLGVDIELLREVSRLEELNSRQGRRRDQRRLFRWSV